MKAGRGLSVTVKRIRRDTAIVKIDGLVDAFTYSKLQRKLDDLLNNNFLRFGIDCTDLYYMSSVGVGIFINLFSVVNENGGDMVLIRPQGAVKDTLDLLGLSKIMSMVKSVKEAEQLLLE